MPRRRTFTRTGQQEIVPLAARTTNGQSDGITNWSAAAVSGLTPQCRLTITAGSGTSLTVVVEDSPDNSTWTVRDTFPAQTGVATVTRALPTTLVAFQRVRWTIVSGNFTFSVQFAGSTGQLL
jgi:hypothetical protein